MTVNSLAQAVGPVRRSPGTSIELAEALLGIFTSGDYRPGDRLPGERQLAEDLGVGRSTTREALKSLAVLGIIEVRQGDGTYLRQTTSDLLPRMVEWGVVLGDRSINSLAEARHHVEVSLAGLAAERHSPEDLERVREAYAGMERAVRAEDLTDFVGRDLDFHLALASAAHSEVLEGILRNISGLLLVWTQRVLEDQVSLSESLAVHRPILDAVEARDSEEGRATMDRHMVEAVRHFREATADL